MYMLKHIVITIILVFEHFILYVVYKDSCTVSLYSLLCVSTVC